MLASVNCLNHVWITGRIAPKSTVGFDRNGRSEWTETNGRIAPNFAGSLSIQNEQGVFDNIFSYEFAAAYLSKDEQHISFTWDSGSATAGVRAIALSLDTVDPDGSSITGEIISNILVQNGDVLEGHLAVKRIPERSY